MATNPVFRTPELKLETEKKNSVTTVRASGRIILETAATLEKTLRDLIGEGNRIVLDLTNVDYVDSAGLGALVSIYMHAKRTNCHLTIANPKERIRDLFSRSGLDPVFKNDSFDVMWEAWSRDNS
jgi:anti-sigma B factor antagonist